jgi:hypothetical protein
MTAITVQDATLLERRKRDYILLLAIMILSFVSLGPLTRLMPPESMIPITVSGITIIAWYLLCFRITANFYASPSVRWLYAGLLIFQLLFNGYVNFQAEASVEELALSASVGYVANIAGFGVVFYILLQDIFRQRHDLAYSLLGASNIYFLIPILFTYVYCLVAVHDPASIGADAARIDTVLLNCFNYSWYVIASVDYPGTVGEGLQLIGVLEAITGNLFMVFIIGRLMTK